MKVSQVAAQLYTVRDHLKTKDDFAASLKKIRKIGYQAVELAGLGPLSEAELAKMLAGEGLTCCAAHENGAEIIANPGAVVERMKKLGSRYASYPHPSGVKLDTLAGVRSLAAGLNAAGKVMQEAGIVLTYHNHSIEFRRVEGRLILDVIYGETDPRYLQAEIDTYWVQHGGGDPEDWCRLLKNRLPLLHLKDYAMTPESRPTFAEIGSGNLNWKPIVAAAEASGCKWYIVEQDTCPGDPFDSLKMSFEYIAGNLCA
jgi:sugar phosphate isomerase/epimerase